MRRAAAVLVAFLILSGCTREEARARLQDDIPADTIDIIHARFPCHSPDLHFFGYRFRVILEGGIRRRRHLLGHVDAAMELAHPAGGRVSRASTLTTSVRGRIDQEIAPRQFCATSMAEPRSPEGSKKCSRP